MALFLLVLAAAAAGLLVARRRQRAGRRGRSDDRSLPPLVFPVRTIHAAESWPHDGLPPQPIGPGTAVADTAEPADRIDGAGITEVGEEVAAGPIRFHRPPEGTLQLLPGRLEIESGKEEQEEIRFVRVSGHDAVVTFGRSGGEPHRHIQLRSRTVSRLHASLTFRDGRWYVDNLSRTNPVVLNDRQLPVGNGGEVRLEDGDRLEMGEVVFRYRDR